MARTWDGVPTFETEQARIRKLVAESDDVRRWLIDGHHNFKPLLDRFHEDQKRFYLELLQHAERVLESGHIWEPGVENATNREEVQFPTLWPSRPQPAEGPMAIQPRPMVRRAQKIAELIHMPMKTTRRHELSGPRRERRAAGVALAMFRPFLRWYVAGEADQHRDDYFSGPEFAELIATRRPMEGIAKVHVIPPRPRPTDPLTRDPQTFLQLTESDRFVIMCHWLCALHDIDSTMPLVPHTVWGASPYHGGEWRGWLSNENWPLGPKAWSEWIGVLEKRAEAVHMPASQPTGVSDSLRDRFTHANDHGYVDLRFFVHGGEGVSQWNKQHPDSALVHWRDWVDEGGIIAIRGLPENRDRYERLAGVAWRALATKPPPALRDLIAKVQNLRAPSDDKSADMVRWTRLVFEAAWKGGLTPNVVAKRRSWIPGAPTVYIDLDGPQTVQQQVDALEWAWSSKVPKDGMVPPDQWNHFYADIQPGILEASAMLLEWIASHDASVKLRVGAPDSATSETLATIASEIEAIRRKQEASETLAVDARRKKSKKRRRPPVPIVRPLTKVETATLRVVGRHGGNIAAAAAELGRNSKTVRENYDRAMTKSQQLLGHKSRSVSTVALQAGRRGQEEPEDRKAKLDENE
jgi:hypothetical protein